MTTKEIWVGVDWGKEEKKKKQTNQMDEGVSFHAQFTRVLFWHKQLIFLPNAIIWSLHIYCKEATEFLNVSLWTGRMRETREREKKE